MKNVLNIFSHDIRKCTSSVVAIITIMGLCIIPCLYAWFNIFSNWAPYEADATGRILVAVANEDAGAEAVGLSLNVGDKIVSGLEANDAIGWVFVDSASEAKKGVLAGKYYAALVIPEDFSTGVLSFIGGSLDNPKLKYYENEKKNAIAPKITGKAKTAVQEQVNATFVQTLAEYVATAVSVADATGLNPQLIIGDLSGKVELLSERLDDCIVMLDAAQSLSDAAASLLTVSGTLTDSAGGAIESEQRVLDTAATIAPEDDTDYSRITESVNEINNRTNARLDKLEQKLNEIKEDRELYDTFVYEGLDAEKKSVAEMIKANKTASESLKKLNLNVLAGHFDDMTADLEAISAKLDLLEPSTDENWPEMQQNVQDILDILGADKAGEIAEFLRKNNLAELDAKLKKALAEVETSISDMQASLDGMGGLLEQMGDIFAQYNGSLGSLGEGMDSTRSDLVAMRSGLDALAALMNRFAGNEELADADRILSNNTDKFASYLASPVKMNTEVIYPIETYGSAMAPFYTVLAQWVGALLTAVLIKTGIRKRDDLVKPGLAERFFGRYGLYLMIGLAQALIVSLGDLLYVGIQCPHPVLFVLAACMNGICFTMINYALVFALDNIGLGAGVIILVLQVAGSGGTYPVEVLPPVFRTLYPLMPFRYSMNAMRECIGGMYGNTYIGCLGALCIFILAAIVLGLVLYRPAFFLNRMIAESKKKSDIML